MTAVPSGRCRGRATGAAVAAVLLLLSLGPGVAPAQAQAQAQTDDGSSARFAGPGRIDTAVAIARAGFPEGAAVAYLARADAFPDALAAGALEGGPILLVPRSGPLPEVVSAEIARLDVERVVALGGQGAVGDDVLAQAAQAAAGVAIGERYAGPGRIETAVAIARAGFPQGAGVVYIARADAFPDALAAGALTGGPIVLVPSTGQVPEPVLKLVRDLNPTRVVALGGQGAVSDQVLRAAAQGKATGRLAGSGRIDTAVQISKAGFPQTAQRVFLARADSFPDALAAGALKGGPILLVPPTGTVPTSVLSEVERLRVAQVVALGGPGAVSDGVVAQVAERVAAPVYLRDLRAASQSTEWSRGQAQTNGRTFLRSLMVFASSTTRAAEYDLGRDQARFRATVGLRDDARDVSTPVQLEVLLDGRLIHEERLSFGQSRALDLPVTNGLRLRLQVTRVGTSSSSAPFVFGNARLLAPGMQDTPGAAAGIPYAPPQRTVYLTQSDHLVSRSPDVSSGQARVNGTDYLRSVIMFASSTTKTIDYDLARAYDSLQATVGIRDDARDTTTPARVEILLDGRQIWARDVRFGESHPITLDLSGGLRLHVRATRVGSSSSSVPAVLGDLRVNAP
jgi:putative cell wall-binding protein